MRILCLSCKIHYRLHGSRDVHARVTESSTEDLLVHFTRFFCVFVCDAGFCRLVTLGLTRVIHPTTWQLIGPGGFIYSWIRHITL